MALAGPAVVTPQSAAADELPEPTITSNAADGYVRLDPADPEATAQDGVGRYGAFDVAFDARATRYSYAMNTTPGTPATTVPGTHTARITVMPTRPGVNQLFVAACDAVNNCSQGVYPFWVKAGSAPVAHWNLDEPAGSTQLADSADKTGGLPSFPATTSGTVTLGAPGVVGSAMTLPGTFGSYAKTSGKVVSTDKSFTVAAWIKPAFTAPGDRPILSQDGTRGGAFALYYNQGASGHGSYGFKMQDPNSNTPAFVEAEHFGGVFDQWAHLVGVYDWNLKQIRLYVNGELKQTVAQPNDWAADGPFNIGRFKAAGGFNGVYFKGGIDDVQVFGRVITGDEAQELFTVQPVLRARWRLNDKSTTTPPTTPDSAADGTHHLTLSGQADTTTTDALVGSGMLNLPGGAADYASAATTDWLDTSKGFTVSLWVQISGDAVTKSMRIFSIGGTAGDAIVLRYDATKQRYVLDIADGDSAGAAFASVEHDTFHQGSYGDWNNIVVSYDSFKSEITLYVNGQANRAVDNASFLEHVRVFAPVTTFQLGRAITDGNNLEGQLDEVWVMQGSIDDSQASYFNNRTELEGGDIPPRSH